MGSIYISTRLHSHPAIIRLPARAIWPWVESVCWLQRNGRLTAFPFSMAQDFGAGKREIRALFNESMWIDDGLMVQVPQYVPSYRGGTGVQLWRFGPISGPSRPHIPDSLRQAVYARDGYACLHCGATDRLSLDHVHPFSRGGKDTFDNLQTLCRPCNSRKGARV